MHSFLMKKLHFSFRGVAPVGDVGVLTPTLFPVRGFNTRTFSAVFPQFCTNALLQSFLRFSGRSVCQRSLRLPPLPLPLKHDTGFECDRLMIGCSALSPASLGVLDVSPARVEAGTWLKLLECLSLFTSPLSRYFEWVFMLWRFLNKLDMCLGRCSFYVLLTCRVFAVLCFVF